MGLTRSRYRGKVDSMILCIGTTPAAQRVMVFDRLRLDSVNRAAVTLDGAAGKSINVAKVLHALGEAPKVITFLGGDRGEFLHGLLLQRGIDTERISVPARTRQCVTVIDRAAGTHTELVEESAAVDPPAFERLRDAIRRDLAHCRAVVLSGTIAPGGPASLYLECARWARDAGALSVVDAQGEPLIQALAAEPDLVKPNRAELAATVARELDDEAAVRTAMHELVERGAKRVIVTAGRNPTLAFDGATFWRIVSPPITAMNPIGSGDSFTAGLVWRLVHGDDLGEACRWGAAAGTANALTLMAGEVERSTVDRLAREIKAEPL
jgi:tagatose 6-phosphate kinase